MKKNLNWGMVSEYRNEIFGLSAILVIISHAPGMKLPVYLESVRPLLIHGNIGVDIFLFLSGMGLWFSFSKDQNIKNFYMKRIRRLLSPWICIAVPYFIIQDLLVSSCDFGQFFMDISTLSFWANGSGMWFVSYIVVCYLVFPLVFKGLNRKKPLFAAVIICIGLVAANIFMYIYFYDCFARLELARGVIFVLGCCFAPKIQQKKEITMAVPIGCIFMYFVTRIAIVLIMRNVSQVVVKTTAIRYAYIWAAMGIMLFVPVFLQWADNCSLNKALRWFGGISIEVYLMHVCVMNIYSISAFGREHMEVIYYFLIIVPVSVVLAWGVKGVTAKLRISQAGN